MYLKIGTENIMMKINKKVIICQVVDNELSHSDLGGGGSQKRSEKG